MNHRRSPAAPTRRRRSGWPLVALGAALLSFTLWPSTASATTGHASVATTAAAKRSTSSPKSMFPATGYFSVAKKHNTWYLVTPQGDPFYASGIDSVATDGSGTDQVTGQCPYCQTVQKDFPNTTAWATATVAQLRSWGFNSLGAYSDDSLLRTQMPYEVQLSMGGSSSLDWFDPSFVTNADQVAATQVAPLANDPNVIGYFTDSELDWGPLLGNGQGYSFNTALQQYLQLPAGSPGLAVAQQYQGDPSGFLTALATRYFSVTTAAVRMYDTHHLILGVKAEGQEIEPNLLKAAAPYVNVFSIEDYVLMPGFAQFANLIWPPYLPVQQDLANFASDFNGPLMIGEYSFMASAPQTPSTVPGIYLVAPDQPTRANEYENFMAPLYEDSGAVVGDDWFQYVDEPANGRTGDGENDNFGMVDVNGNPYPEVAAATQLMHGVIAHQRLDSGPICDSWANTGSGVTCTAYMPTSPNFPLTIVTDSLSTGKVGTSYYFGGVYAAGGTPGYSYSVTQGSIPKGLKFNRKTGIILGTPKVAGTSSFTVTASDSGGSTPVSQALSITVDPDVKVSVRTTSLRRATVGTSYSATLLATGGTAPYTWSITGGTPPAGLSIGSNGALTGNPTVAGTFPITVKVVDSTSPTETATANLTLTVKS